MRRPGPVVMANERDSRVAVESTDALQKVAILF